MRVSVERFERGFLDCGWRFTFHYKWPTWWWPERLKWGHRDEPVAKELLLKTADVGHTQGPMTQVQLTALIQRVQKRVDLYTERGMDPLKVETLLDDVHRALREFSDLKWVTDEQRRAR